MPLLANSRPIEWTLMLDHHSQSTKHGEHFRLWGCVWLRCCTGYWGRCLPWGLGKLLVTELRLKPCFSGVRSRFLIAETASSIILSLQRQKCRYGLWIGSDPAVGLVGARNHRILYSSDFSGSQVISPQALGNIV